MKKHVLSILALSILFIPLLLSSSESTTETEFAEYPEEPFGSWRQLEWEPRNPEAQAKVHGLLIMEAAARGLVERLIYESSAGHRLIVTRTVIPREGRLIENLLDDRTGWWIELQLDFDHSWNGWRHFALTVDEHFQPGSGRSIQGVLTTKDGLEFDLSLPPAQGLPDAAGFTNALERIQAKDPLVASIPGPVVPALFELTAVLSTPPATAASSDWLAGLLREVLPAPEDGPATRTGWTEKTGEIRAGLHLVQPASLEFVSHFQSVSNTSPLDDHRLQEVIPP